jgi:hypothetical protein
MIEWSDWVKAFCPICEKSFEIFLKSDLPQVWITSLEVICKTCLQDIKSFK